MNVRGEFSAAWKAYIEGRRRGWAMLSTPEVERPEGDREVVGKQAASQAVG